MGRCNDGLGDVASRLDEDFCEDEGETKRGNEATLLIEIVTTSHAGEDEPSVESASSSILQPVSFREVSISD